MQVSNHNPYKQIKLSNSALFCLVDQRDYERLSNFNWGLQRSHGEVVVSCDQAGKTILLHREIVGYHSTDDFTHISHRNGNKLDNRFSNLVCKVRSGSRLTRFHFSDKLRNKFNSISPVLVVAEDGLVHHHSLVGIIAKSHKEIDMLLCQRLKSVQLIIDTQTELLRCKSQLLQAANEIDGAIESLNETINAMQPSEIHSSRLKRTIE